MIYDSLDIIPYKTFIKIVETGNVQLLSHDITDKSILNEVWDRIYQEHLQEAEETQDGKRIFRLAKEIDALGAKHKVILMACEALKFDWNDDLVDLLKKYGYAIRNTNTEDYYSDIQKIERESNALAIKASNLRNQLPKSSDNQKVTIDDIMASYSAILGIDFDYNTLPYRKFFALQKQVDSKIKALEKQVTQK